MHSQQNYLVLQEGQFISDYISMGTYRYYSFTLIDDKDVKNVTFRLNSMHGDADLYVSRVHKFPNKLDNEKSSAKVNDIVDQVFFDRAPLRSTYYIGVYSYQYSTFNLMVSVDRGQQIGMDQVPALIEGVPVSSSIGHKDGNDQYKLRVKFAEGYEKAIRIGISPLKNKVKMFVNVEKQASAEQFLWQTEGNTLEIKPNDPNYRREGTYYIRVVPVAANIWQSYFEKTWQYMITYSTEASYLYLQTKTPFENKQKAQSYSFFRHFVTESN